MTRKHEVSHGNFYAWIRDEIRRMNLRWSSLGATTQKALHSDGGSREADSSGQPFDFPHPGNDKTWPTLVVESSVSRSLDSLHKTIGWWFAASQHAVKIVILVKIYRDLEQITVEKWTEDYTQFRPGATTTCAAASLIAPVL